ncbi:MAG TPA: preprotein translocase subunit YajC [Blastocatellia bacterium]|jgi:preprotein translocase subunit YajC|nr:preprotein translocase subunit YajC [Blastocatellia bacterium]
MDMTIDSGALLFIQPANGGGGGLLISLMPMLIIFLIFYFLVIRPQQKRQRQAQAEREQLLKSLKPGDKVVTSGGIYGTIVAVRDKEDTVQLRIAQSVSIEVLRSSIAGPQSSEVKEVEAAK